MWVKKNIPAIDSSMSGKVVFCANIYEIFHQLCMEYGAQVESEKITIMRLGDVLPIIKTIVKTAREFGS